MRDAEYIVGYRLGYLSLTKSGKNHKIVTVNFDYNQMMDSLDEFVKTRVSYSRDPSSGRVVDHD